MLQRRVIRFAFALLTLPAVPSHAAGWLATASTTATWDSNATRADHAGDRIAALDVLADVAATRRLSITRDDGLLVRLHVAGDAWPRYPTLSTAAVGAGLEWQRKFGLGPFAPLLRVGVAADAIAGRDHDRNGGNYVGTLALQKRATDLTTFEAAETLTRRDERIPVYDWNAAETSVAVRHSIGARTQVSLAAFWRHGGVLSYATPPRPDLIALAPVRELEDTFGRPLVAYAIVARSLGARVGAAWAMNDAASVTLGYEYRDTRRAALRYVNQLVSASIALQF